MSRDKKKLILQIYKKLYQLYGPQGWWPLLDLEFSHAQKSGSKNGYHPLNYEIPENSEQQFEIIMGTIITQNTTWTSAEKALINLKELDAVNPLRLLEIDENLFKEAIRCAGFLNQKSVYLKNVAKFFLSLSGSKPSRDDLLEVKGVGYETADSILLYAYKEPEFVVDNYTKRIFHSLGFISEKEEYMNVKKIFHKNLPHEVPLFQEYHALLVEHAKRHYRKGPYTDNALGRFAFDQR